MQHIFKPLRNWLAQLDQLSLLGAIYHLSNHIEWRRPLPQYLQAANPHHLKDPIKLGFFQWELDTLAREAILHSPKYGGRQVTWPEIGKALNLLKWTENEACAAAEYDIFSEMTRIAHRQFHWQQGVSHPDISRYRRIYRHPGMNEVVLKEFGITSEQLFLTAFALIATFLKHFAFSPEYAGNAERLIGVSPQPLIDRLVTTVPELREETLALRSLDIDWAYSFHPLRARPLIRIDDGRTICPIPGLLARRVTDGLYFDFAKNPDNLAKHLGPAFQSYIGDVLYAANDGSFSILPEAEFGTAREPKRTVDWIVEDHSGVLFLECKVLRLAHVGRAKLAPLEPIEREFRKLARAVAQVYVSLEIALNGKYPHWKPHDKPVYPTVVTMDNWNLFTHTSTGTLREMISEELKTRSIDTAIMETHPYTICWARELEIGIQIMHRIGIDAVMRGITTEKAGYLFSAYLAEQFPEELGKAKALFPNEPEALVANLPGRNFPKGDRPVQ